MSDADRRALAAVHDDLSAALQAPDQTQAIIAILAAIRNHLSHVGTPADN